MKTVFAILVVAVCAIMVHGQGFHTATCPPGEHSVLYCPQKAEPSCDNPTLHELTKPAPCDVPKCFCNTPTIRNTKTGKCVQPKDC